MGNKQESDRQANVDTKPLYVDEELDVQQVDDVADENGKITPRPTSKKPERLKPSEETIGS